MDRVSKTEYPSIRPWDLKVSAVPNIPRGDVGLDESLGIILEAVAAGKPQSEPVAVPGSNSTVTLGTCCRRLRPVGLVRDRRGSWTLSGEAKTWLSSRDNSYLAAVLCSNIKYMAEMLSHMQEPKKAADLLEIANGQYGMPWKKASEINRRTVWFRDLGLLVFHEYSLDYELTNEGRTFLEQMPIVSPEEINNDADQDKTVFSPSDWAIELCDMGQSQLASRRNSIGYYPGGKADIATTLSEYVSFLKKPRSKEEVEEYSAANYGIKSSSSRSLLNMLSGIGFIERVSRDAYQATPRALEWGKEASPIDLACCIHASCLFVLEILAELRVGPKSKNDLSAASIVSYGFEKENGAEVLKRIHFLQNAGLLKDYRANEFTITQSGIDLLDKVSIQSRSSSTQNSVTVSNGCESLSYNQALLTELRLSCRESADPDRFERACTAAFQKLGFNAEWIGGSGRTDVLVSAYSAAKYVYRVTVDAKSTSNGLVNESQLNFDTLVDHRKLHDAQYAVVVGCGFQGDRIASRAEKHKIVLLDVDSLCDLIVAHEAIPLGAQDYRALFETCGTANLAVLDEARKRLSKNGLLLRSVMSCLAEESTDEVSGGTLSVRELYFILKASEPGLASTTKEIENILEFLSSPLINCVCKVKDEYYAIGSLSEAANKFAFFGNACGVVK